MSTRATSNIPNNVNVSKHSAGSPNDEHAKPTAALPFSMQAITGNAIEVWADGAIWDTVANKFLTTNDVKRA